MRICTVRERTPLLIQALLAVWEDSVRATHLFLSEAEIQEIRKYVPQALNAVAQLIVAEDESGRAIGFMGVEGDRLEMLFLAADARGNGLGRRLLEYGIRRYGIARLTVNEQNPQAIGFYRHMGFEICGRTERDEQGNPYPLLYMQRAERSVPMNEAICAHLEGCPAEIAELFLSLRALVFRACAAAEEKMWAKLPSYYSGERFVRLIPFRDHINVEARAIAAHSAELTGYKLTPKGMLQIYMHQEIPREILLQSFSETLNS